MTLPLIVLAVLAFGGGYIDVPHWLSPAFPLREHENLAAMLISASLGIIGILLAAYLYVIRPALPERLKTSAGPLYTLVANKYYVDEIYFGLIVRPITAMSRILWTGVDESVIDAAGVNGLGRVVAGWGGILRHFQSGSIRNYATWVLAGSLLVIFIITLVGAAR